MTNLFQRLWTRLFGPDDLPVAAAPLPATEAPTASPVSRWEAEQIGVQAETSTGRPFGAEVPAEMRRMSGTKMYLTLSDLTIDQQRWYTNAETRWSEHVDFGGQDFHLLYAHDERRWLVRLGSTDGPELVVDPPFDLHNWGGTGQTIRRRLVHLFMDRNEIPGRLFVYRQRAGTLFETETVTAG